MSMMEPAELMPPVIRLRVRVPPAVGAGQELTYLITVENQSRAAAHHVLVRNAVPQHARFVRAQPAPSELQPELVWTLGTLEGGARKEITLVLAADGKGDVESCPRVQFEHGQCVTTKVARAGISVRKGGPTRAVLYDNLTFQVFLTNTGPTAVTNVVLTETLSPGLEHALGNRVRWDVGTLAPGQTRVIDYQAIAKQAGTLRVQTLVTADGGLREEAQASLIAAEPKLSVQLAGPAQQYVNTNVPYQVAVRNLGTIDVANVRVGFQLPPQTQLVSATRGAQRIGDQVQWELGTLSPNSLRILDAVVRVPTAGEARLEALAVADRGLEKRDVLVTVFAGVPALTLNVVKTDDPLEVGKETRYLVSVRNPGTQPVTQTRLVVTLPEQLAFVRATAPQGANFKREGQKILFDPLTARPGTEVRFEIAARGLKPADTRILFAVNADQLTAGAVSESVSTTIYADP